MFFASSLHFESLIHERPLRIPLFRYIGRQFFLLVSIIRRLTGKQRGQSLQHLQCQLLNILSFQPLDFIKEIGIIQTFVFNYFSFFNLMFTIHGR